ncbi:hypothetical protein DXG01_006908 [Tephrocybe rancida]|nr:hypothetical protein DXG01_006908 [Tephrocybe rancida]
MAQMSNKDLEHAALAPAQFAAFIMKRPDHPDQSILPHSTRILLNDEVDVKFDDLYLIPGGRFLITLSNRIALWDLGAQTIIPRPLASTAQQNGLQILDCCPTSDDQNSPGFQQLSVLRDTTGMSIKAASYTQSIVAILLDNDRVVLWDFARDTISLNIVRGHGLRDILVMEDHIIVFDGSGFSLYKIPELVQRNPTLSLAENSSNGYSHPLALDPVMNIAHPHPRPYHYLYAMAHSWFSNYNGRPQFSLVGSDQIRDCVVNQYMMVDIKHPYLPSRTPILLSSVSTQEQGHENPLIRPCDRYIVMTSVDSLSRWGFNVFMLESSHKPLGESSHGEFVKKRLWTAPLGIEPLEAQLCASSGRFCVLLPESSEIRVMDYLPPL